VLNGSRGKTIMDIPAVFERHCGHALTRYRGVAAKELK